MSFWDVLWFIFISFALMAYLMVLFSIIGDLFRDRDASGVEKAVWMVGLIFLPFLTALLYLITRGGKMAERSERAAEALKAQQDAYIREVAGTNTPANQIAQARSLLESGVINESEFESIKAKVLV